MKKAIEKVEETAGKPSNLARRKALVALAGAGLALGVPVSAFGTRQNGQDELLELEAALLEFRLVFNEWAPGRILVTLEGEEVFLGSESVGEVVEWIESSDGTSIRYQLSEEGARKSEALTRKQIDGRMAVLYAGRVLAAPTVRGVIGKQGMISLSAPILRTRKARSRF